MRNTLIRSALIRGTATAWTQQPQQQQYAEADSDTTDGADTTDTDASDQTDDTDGDKPDESDKDWKAEAEKNLAFSRKHEERAKANAAAAKELAELKKAQMSDTEKATTAQKEADARAEAAEGKAARLEAAVTYGLSKSDVDTFLTGIAADRVDDVAKALAKRLAKAAPAAGGAPAGGAAGKTKATTLDAAVAGHYTK